MRTTKQQLRERVERLQRQGADIAIGWAYDQPRCTNRAQDRDISPRLAISKMAIWLQAYETGIEEGRRQNYYVVRGIPDALDQEADADRDETEDDARRVRDMSEQERSETNLKSEREEVWT